MAADSSALAALEKRVLVLAPSGRDAALACQVLEQAQIAAVVCADVAALIAAMDEGAGAAVLASEAIGPDVIAALAPHLQRQPAWSDFPLLIFTAGAASTGENRRTLEAFADLGNVTALERPIHPLTMVSATRAALRARARQYAARAALVDRERDVRQRDEFLALLGHELRNPLGALRNAATLVERSGGGVPGLDRPLAMIDRQLRHLTQLVDDLLDVARVTSGKIVLKVVPVDLVAAARAMVDEMAKASRERRLQIDLRVPDEAVVVRADPVRLDQILTNLVTNALKYTPSEGRIDVSVAVERGEAVLRVADTGVGLSADMLPTIFEPFTQAARTLDRSQGGIGLGLSVVRALARLHGGDVAVTSEGLGRGSEFIVRLPHAAGADVAVDVGERTPAPLTMTPRHILIVEDGADHRESLQELLEAQGHRVDTAIDGECGVEQALAGRPEVALVDIGLPRLDGYEVARRIRGAMGPKIFLIALTGYGQPDDRARAAAAGFDVHITKPLDFGALERLIAGGRGL
ncbi:MAG TPA: hybrid sensor histidine kinase/response regulator [Polyangia bacterium]|nr:hybrid sensor histidine kinase/response regulator [Polyangia bacterium]